MTTEEIREEYKFKLKVVRLAPPCLTLILWAGVLLKYAATSDIWFLRFGLGVSIGIVIVWFFAELEFHLQLAYKSHLQGEDK